MVVLSYTTLYDHLADGSDQNSNQKVFKEMKEQGAAGVGMQVRGARINCLSASAPLSCLHFFVCFHARPGCPTASATHML